MSAIHKIVVLIISLLFIYDVYFTNTPTGVRIQNPKFSLLSPFNISSIPVMDVYDQLIDIKKFKFLKNTQPCQNYEAGILLVIIVSSNPNNAKNRMVIRSTWGRSIESTKVVFLLGEVKNYTLSKEIMNESLIYRDIIQGNFFDVYRNMTYKHAMGLKWVTHHCNNAKYVLKTDDDVVVNSHMLRRFLARELSPWGAKELIACQVLENAHVQRSQLSKWKVSMSEYSSDYYPTYCAGWAILYSQDVVSKLLNEIQTTPYFWIDDVHITGVIAQKLGITQTSIASLILSQTRANLLVSLGPDYVGSFLFGPPDINVNRIYELWKAIPE